MLPKIIKKYKKNAAQTTLQFAVISGTCFVPGIAVDKEYLSLHLGKPRRQILLAYFLLPFHKPFVCTLAKSPLPAQVLNLSVI